MRVFDFEPFKILKNLHIKFELNFTVLLLSLWSLCSQLIAYLYYASVWFQISGWKTLAK
jgi:hypothetical protein